MSKLCPLTNETVLSQDCVDCNEKCEPKETSAAPKEIVVPIPHLNGSLVAQPMGDPDYPGIALFFRMDSGPEIDLALAEAPKDAPDAVSVYEYRDAMSDEWTDKFRIIKDTFDDIEEAEKECWGS